jgi:hypothetical protein
LSDNLFWYRQHSCNERELCSAPRIHGHSWQNIIRWNVIFFGQYLNVKMFLLFVFSMYWVDFQNGRFTVVDKFCPNYSVGSYTFLTFFGWFKKKLNMDCGVSIRVKLLFPLKSSCSMVCYKTLIQLTIDARLVVLFHNFIILKLCCDDCLFNLASFPINGIIIHVQLNCFMIDWIEWLLFGLT